MLEDALALHAQGRLAEAEEAYRAILAREPENAGVGHQLALLALDAGMPQAAVPIFEHVCLLAPGDAAFHANRGLGYLRCGRFADAVAASDRAIALNPGLFQAHLHRGTALKELQRPEEALESFARAAGLRDDAATHNLRALMLDELGRYQEALDSFTRALALDGDNPLAHSNHGHALLRLFRYGPALASFEKAVTLGPEMSGLHYNLGDPLKALGRLEEALAAYDRAIALEPDMTNAHVNRGLVLMHLGRGDEALAAFDRAIVLEPDTVAARIGRSGALTGAGRIEEALAYDRELARHPLFRPEADFHSAMVLLHRGDWEEGWKYYEARRDLDRPGSDIFPRFAQPEWNGQTPLTGKTLFVHGEQGLGDNIQFARFLPLARRAGARVIFSPKGRLRRLLDGQGLADEVLPTRSVPEAFDLHIPLASMPRAFNTRRDNIPAEISYLHAEPALVEKWRARIGAQGFKIGVCWAGAFDPIQGLDRSFPLKQCAVLAALPGVRLISLQKFEGLEQLAELPAGMTVEELGEDFDNGPEAFVDAAAVMASLDLVISCDTATAHLAGALGGPAWTVLKRHPEWRWGEDGETSPWYPAMTLFRQQAAGAWEPVFAAMRARLAAQLGVA
jgi:tetratricopeptide (TPR) repeat protein